MKYASFKSAGSAATLISLLLILGTLLPTTARAFVLGDFVSAILHTPEKQQEVASGSGNLQTMVLPKPAMNADPMAGKGGGDITIVDGNAVAAEEGPSGTAVDIEKPKNSKISIYVVREGDTLSGIADLYDVSVNTILWANDLTKTSKLRVGEVLTILPVTSVRYTVKKGDTLTSIAKRFHADAVEIGTFNGIDDASLASGMTILIPNGEIAASSPSAGISSGISALPGRPTPGGILYATLNSRPGTPTQVGYYVAPLAHYVKTQGVHGYNGVDLAAPVGTPILAAAAGDVLIAKEGGWNAGYGTYVVIRHSNGTQTLYAHQSKVAVSPGQRVEAGQVIGYVGLTGKTTGPHVHFEIRNGIKNPF